MFVGRQNKLNRFQLVQIDMKQRHTAHRRRAIVHLKIKQHEYKRFDCEFEIHRRNALK